MLKWPAAGHYASLDPRAPIGLLPGRIGRERGNWSRFNDGTSPPTNWQMEKKDNCQFGGKLFMRESVNWRYLHSLYWVHGQFGGHLPSRQLTKWPGWSPKSVGGSPFPSIIPSFPAIQYSRAELPFFMLALCGTKSFAEVDWNLLKGNGLYGEWGNKNMNCGK